MMRGFVSNKIDDKSEKCIHVIRSTKRDLKLANVNFEIVKYVVGMRKIDNFSYRFIDNKHLSIDNNQFKSKILLIFIGKVQIYRRSSGLKKKLFVIFVVCVRIILC